MNIIDFNMLVEKKKERDRIKALVDQGKSSIDNYIEALKDEIEAQAEYIDVLIKKNRAHEELEKKYKEYIAFLTGNEDDK